jgi:hypothetical protein
MIVDFRLKRLKHIAAARPGNGVRKCIGLPLRKPQSVLVKSGTDGQTCGQKIKEQNLFQA